MTAPTIINGQQRDGRPRAADLAQQIGPAMVRTAYESGVNFSVWLEAQDPSSENRDGLDAFERQLRMAKIVTRSHRGMGRWADEFGAFTTNEKTRTLATEWFARTWRGVVSGQSPSTRAIYTSSDDLPGGSLRPYAESSALRTTPEIKPPIMLSDLVALTTPVTGNAYRSTYLTPDAANTRQVRVAESSDIPLFKLSTSAHTINLLKYGGGLEITYEALRRTRLDKVAFWVAQMAIQSEIDKVAKVISVLVSGDGNAGTAATVWRAKTDFDPLATGKTLTLLAWLSLRLKFFPLYQMQVVLASEGDMLKVGMLNLGTTALPSYMFDTTSAPGFNNRFRDGTMYGVTANAPADTIVVLDPSRALERVTEIGSDIQEIERFARNQTQNLYMTENEGYAILQPGAAMTLLLEA